MGDAAMVVTALLAALAAAGAGMVPVPALLALAVLAPLGWVLGGRVAGRAGGTAGRRAWRAGSIAVLLVAVVGLRAHQDLAGLSRPAPRRIDGMAELGSDPDVGRFGATAVLIAEGRRWWAAFDRDHEGVVRGLMTGDRLRVRGTVGPLVGVPAGWVRSRHLAGRLTVSAAEPAGGTRWWFRAANAVHTLLRRGAGSMGDDQRALYLGLVVGDDRGQSDITRHRFRASGLTHLLVVSGQNLAFLFAVLSPLSRRLGLRWRWAVGVAATVGFVLVTRAEPSVLRAAAMALVALGAAATGRTAPGIRVVAIAVLVVLVGDPLLVQSVGFQLSVAATVGLVVLVGPLRRWLPGPDWLRTPVAVTVAAQAGATPVMALVFGSTSVLGVLANLAAEPAAGAVMTLGLSVGLVAGLVREEVASVAQLPSRAMVWWIDGVATVTSRLCVPPPGPAGWLAVVGGVALGSVAWRRWGRRGMGRVVMVAVVPMVVVLRPPSATGTPVAVTAGVELRHECRGWAVAVGGRLVDAAKVAEALWQRGLGHVAVVEAAPGTRGADELAGALAAALRSESGGPTAEARSDPPEPSARGSPCPR